MDEEHRSDPLYNSAKEILATSPSLSERFCSLTDSLATIDPGQISPELLEALKPLFYDVSLQIQRYNEQYQVLVSELGVLCHTNGETRKTIPLFFTSMVDFLGLGLSLYESVPDKRERFAHVLDSINQNLLTKGRWQLPEDPLEKALLIQLVKSSWAFVHPDKDLSYYANQVRPSIGGSKKTRKLKRRG